MATESPIRMMVPRGKWSSSPVNVAMEEHGLPANSQYQTGRFNAPNRSESAPPSMEGSIAALYSFNVDASHSLQRPVRSASDDRLLDGAGTVSNNRGVLPTHREESEDDASPHHACNDWTGRNSPMLSELDASSSASGHRSFVDQTQGNNADINSLPDQSISVPSIAASTINVNDASGSRSISHARTKGHKDDPSSVNSHLENEATATDDASEIADVRSRIKALKISPPINLDVQSSQEERQHFIYQDNFVRHPNQQNNILQFQNFMHQVAPQGMNNPYIDMSQFAHLGKLPPAEMQPVFQPSGSTQPHYSAPPAYLPPANPYYPTMQPPGVMYTPPYGLAGYSYNPMVLPPHLSGYPPNTAPSVPQYNPLALSSGFVQGQGNAFNSHTRPEFSGAVTDHRPQNHGAGGIANVSQRRGAVATPSYVRSPANMGVLQIPTSPLPSPLLPSSPMSGNLPFGRSESYFPHDSSRNAGFYAGWPAQRGYESLNCTKTYSFLEELKSGKGRRHDLSEIAGHVVEFSVDQHGSRFIQQKLENCSADDKASVFKEVLPHASKLMTDVFGNYVIQKLFEYGTTEQKKELANQMRGEIISLSMQMYGCRVIQKALEVIELEQKADLVHELDGHVMRCVRDQNGNHVIQKCIESIPIEKIDFIISAFHGQVASLSMHPYGCRVIQRVLERCADGPQSQFIVDEILESVCTLAQNQYGNYVTQHVLEKGKAGERIQIIKKLAGQVVQLSQHKFASNVIEKCLQYGDTEGRELLIGEIIGSESNDNLVIMMKDQYANYVVQKVLDLCTDSQRDLLRERIQVHLTALRKYTYGKHIVARFEQLYGEEFQASGSQDG